MRGLKVQGGCNMIPKIIVRPNYFPLWWCDNINKYMINNVEVDKNFGRKGVRRCDVRMLTPEMRPFNDVFNSLLNFTKQQLQYKLSAGQVIIFPSMVNHKVTPVTAGIRKTLVTWYSGPMWR